MPDLVRRISAAADSAGLGTALRWVPAAGGLLGRDARLLTAYEHGFVFARKEVTVFSWPDIEVCRVLETADDQGRYRFNGWVEFIANGQRLVLKPRAGELPLAEEQLWHVSTMLLAQYHSYLAQAADDALRQTGRFSFGAAEINAQGVLAGDVLLPWHLTGPAKIVHGHLHLHDTSSSHKPVHLISGSSLKSTAVLARLIDRLAEEHRQHGRLVTVAASGPAATAAVTVEQDPSFTRPAHEEELLAVIEAAAAASGLHGPRRWWLTAKTGAARMLPRSGVVLYDNGFVIAASRKKAYAATWADVTQLFWRHSSFATRPGTLAQFYVVAGKATFDLNNDGTGSLPLHDLTRVAHPLEQAYVWYLRDQRPVRYGKWELGADGLSAKRKSIPWTEVAEAEYNGVDVTLITVGGKRTTFSGPDVGCPLGFALALEDHGVRLTRLQVVR